MGWRLLWSGWSGDRRAVRVGERMVLSERLEDGLVEQAVGGHGAAPVDPGPALEVGETAPGLLDDDQERGQVPGGDLGFDGDLDAALGHQDMGPEVAEAAAAGAAPGQRQEPLLEPADGEAGDAVVGELGLAEVLDAGDVDGPARGEGAAAADRPPAGPQSR